jgi:hypothetical protein
MNYDLVFSAINYSVMPAWALLILAPKWNVTEKLVHSMFYPLLLGVVYSGGFIMAYAGHGAEGGGFTSIEGVRTLFSADVGLVIGWAHYLVFDLFIGAWEARDARRRGFNHWLLIPCLFFTFMAGPIGLLLYLILRKLTGKGGWNLAETQEA